MKNNEIIKRGICKYINLQPFIIYIISILFLTGVVAFEGNTKEFKTIPGKNLEIDLKHGGAVEIMGWTKPVISVSVDVDEYLDYLKFHYNDGDLRIKDSHIRGNIRGGLTLSVRVPEKFNLDIETMGGSVSIDKIEGAIEGETMGGELKFSNLKGTLQFTTMGGEIDLMNSEVEGKLKTMGGELEFTDVIGNIKGSTMGGAIRFHHTRSIKSGEQPSEVHVETMGGEIEVDSAPNGVNANTKGGEIYIGSAGKYVNAKTMGGEITIKEVDGWVKASTMGGDITVTMIGNPKKGVRDVDLSSMGGEISLTVPDGLSMEFDIELTCTKSGYKKYQIISDFPVHIEETESQDYSNGSPTKYIYGTGTVGDGKNRIKIETINGDIYIKKGK